MAKNNLSKPKLCNEIIYNDSDIFITKKWSWNVKSIYKDENLDILKVLLDGDCFNYNGISTLATFDGKRIDLKFDYLLDSEDEMFLVYKQGKGFGYINKNLELVIPAKYKDGKNFCNGYAPVFNGNEWLYVDKNGKELFLENQYEELGNFSDDVAMVSTLNKKTFKLAYACDYKEQAGIWGYVDKSGKEIIKPQYIYASDFVNDRAIVTKGKWVQDKKWDNEYCKGGYWTHKELWGVIDKKGNEIIPCIYDEIKQFIKDDISICQDYFIVHTGGWENGKWAIADRNGNFITEPIFKNEIYYSDICNGLFYFKKYIPPEKEIYGIYDLKSNKILFEPQFEDVTFLDDKHISVEVFDEKLERIIEKIIDINGNNLSKTNYASIRIWTKPMQAIIKNDNKTIIDFINQKGEVLDSLEVDDIDDKNIGDKIDYANKLYCFRDNEKVGIKNFDNEIIIPAIYDNIFLQEHFIEVYTEKNKRYGLYKKDGTLIFEPKNRNIQLYDNKIICNNKNCVEFYEYTFH